jgi:PKD repeat protein
MAVFPVVKFSLSADFTSDITNVPVGQSVHFHDTSVGSPTSWEWTFEGGNPGTSAEQNPIVTYNEAGTYDVTLTIGNDTSTNTKSVADYIIVGGPSIEIDTLNYPLAGEYAVYITNGNGYVSGNNEFGDRAKANYFQSNQDLFVTGVLVEFAYATGGNPNIEIGLWNNAGTNGSPGAKIGSQTVSLNTIKTNINNQQLTYIPFNPPINVASSFYSGFMLPTVTGDTLVVWSNTDGNTNPGIAWEQWNDSQWHSFAQPDNWDLNVALAIFPIVQNTLGIKDYKMDNAINVFPNPSQGIYYVASELFNNEPGKLSIYKLDGTLIQTVVQRNGEILSIDLTNEPPGIYFVKLEIRSGIFVEKIVRQ